MTLPVLCQPFSANCHGKVLEVAPSTHCNVLSNLLGLT